VVTEREARDLSDRRTERKWKGTANGGGATQEAIPRKQNCRKEHTQAIMAGLKEKEQVTGGKKKKKLLIRLTKEGGTPPMAFMQSFRKSG